MLGWLPENVSTYGGQIDRLFSIIQWHHFAYTLISGALLGYGAAWSFVALARRRLLDRYAQVVVAAAAVVERCKGHVWGRVTLDE